MMAARAGKWLSPQAAWGLVALMFGLALAVAAAAAPYFGIVSAQQQIAERSNELRFLERKLGALRNRGWRSASPTTLRRCSLPAPPLDLVSPNCSGGSAKSRLKAA
ncbi:MAG: hypothetical protein HC855_12785 [Rhizobiales bacterium]|nr:hypothetical protein [Hyphomicrobiales bacterium]